MSIEPGEVRPLQDVLACWLLDYIRYGLCMSSQRYRFTSIL